MSGFQWRGTDGCCSAASAAAERERERERADGVSRAPLDGGREREKKGCRPHSTTVTTNQCGKRFDFYLPCSLRFRTWAKSRPKLNMLIFECRMSLQLSPLAVRWRLSHAVMQNQPFLSSSAAVAYNGNLAINHNSFLGGRRRGSLFPPCSSRLSISSAHF